MIAPSIHAGVDVRTVPAILRPACGPSRGEANTSESGMDVAALVCQRSPLSDIDEGTVFTGELDTPYHEAEAEQREAS